MFQLGIVTLRKRNVLGQLVDGQRIAAVLHDVAVHTFPVLAEIVAGIQRFALGLFQYRVGKGRIDRLFSELMSDFEKSMVSFVTSTRIQDTVKLESSFRIFAWIDIGLFAVTIISMYVELRAILISVYSERGKAKNQEIENLTEQTNKSMKGI